MKNIYKLIIILASLSFSSAFADCLVLDRIFNLTDKVVTVKYHENGGHSDVVRKLAPHSKENVSQDIADDNWPFLSDKDKGLSKSPVWSFDLTITTENPNEERIYTGTAVSDYLPLAKWFRVTLNNYNYFDINEYYFL